MKRAHAVSSCACLGCGSIGFAGLPLNVKRTPHSLEQRGAALSGPPFWRDVNVKGVPHLPMEAFHIVAGKRFHCAF